MKSSILWNTPNNQPEKGLDAGQESNSNCNFTSRDGSISPVSSECSVIERTIPVSGESQRKHKSYLVVSPERPVKCSTPTSSSQVLNSSYTESRNQPVDSSLAFPWNFPLGIDPRVRAEKATWADSICTLEVSDPFEAGKRMADYVSCESTETTLALGAKDILVKVERLSDEEVPEEVSQPVSASQSSPSDQQTVPGSAQAQEDLLVSPQSSSLCSVDEVVTEELPRHQSPSDTNAQADDQLENARDPYQLYIAPSPGSTKQPSPNGPDRPFQCPTYGVRFTRIQSLKQHMLIHSGIKPFKCDRCGKMFTRSYSLKMHRRKHEVIS
jgi:zinc finger/BTB domain-containing protein 44